MTEDRPFSVFLKEGNYVRAQWHNMAPRPGDVVEINEGRYVVSNLKWMVTGDNYFLIVNIVKAEGAKV